MGDVLQLSQLELVETLDVPPGEAAALLRTASRSVLSAPVTVRQASAGKELQHSVSHTCKRNRVFVLGGSSAAVWGSGPAPAGACHPSSAGYGPKCTGVEPCCFVLLIPSNVQDLSNKPCPAASAR